MLGIAGMLAKRSQKKVGGDGSDAAAPVAAVSTTTKAATTEEPVSDDPFASFGERPSTAGSFGFNNIGGYSDDFDDFGDDVGDNLDTGDGDGDGMEDQQIDDTHNTIGSSIAEITTNTTTPKQTNGLSLFKNRSSVTKEAPSGVVPGPAVASPPAQPMGASIVPPSPFAPSTDVNSFPMVASFMPPPPPRRPSLLSTYGEAAPLIEDPPEQVEEKITKNNQHVVGFLRTGLSTSTQGFENSIIENATLEPSIVHDKYSAIENDSLSHQAVIDRSATSAAVLQSPTVVLHTPQSRSGHNLSTVVEMSSLESPVPSATPPSTPQQQKFTLQTPFLPSTVNFHRAPVTPDSTIPATAAAAAAAERNNSTNGEDSFDDMFCAVLEYVQAIKDKNHVSGEQMLDMEVQLDHVIATMNVEMLQMQQMEDELSEIQCSQEGIVAMYR